MGDRNSGVSRRAACDEVQADLRRWYGVELVVRDSAMATAKRCQNAGREQSEPD